MRLIKICTWVFLILFWIMVLYNFSDLPEQIPTHFNIMGEADALGSKSNIFLLPAIATMIVLGMGSIKRSQVGESTQQEPSYTNAMRMGGVLRCTIVFLFAGISYQSIQIAFNNSSSLGVFFLPMSLAIIFIPMVFFLWKIFREG
jgi:uncharacterized membrane protein